jgi:hypothetical protein
MMQRFYPKHDWREESDTTARAASEAAAIARRIKQDTVAA